MWNTDLKNKGHGNRRRLIWEEEWDQQGVGDKRG
jgi:hypothetical protein